MTNLRTFDLNLSQYGFEASGRLILAINAVVRGAITMREMT